MKLVTNLPMEDSRLTLEVEMDSQAFVMPTQHAMDPFLSLWT